MELGLAMHSPQLMHSLDIIAYAGFICTLVAIPFLLVNWFRYINKLRADQTLRPTWLKAPFPTKSVIGFALPILVSISAAEVSTSIAHQDVLNELYALPRDSRIFVAGHTIENSQ